MNLFLLFMAMEAMIGNDLEKLKAILLKP